MSEQQWSRASAWTGAGQLQTFNLHDSAYAARVAIVMKDKKTRDKQTLCELCPNDFVELAIIPFSSISETEMKVSLDLRNKT